MTTAFGVLAAVSGILLWVELTVRRGMNWRSLYMRTLWVVAAVSLIGIFLRLS